MMQIAPGIDAASWKALRLDDSGNADWATAIQIFESRINERFIDPVDYLIAAEEAVPPTQRRFGFTVLAIDCLLVETLGAFADGLETTEGQSKATFSKFLTTRPLVSKEFTADLAKRFYEEFRCGILHQAEIGGESKVWSVGPTVWADEKRIIVNRNKFHELLKAEFQGYLSELRDPRNIDLRAKFRKKMDFISRS